MVDGRSYADRRAGRLRVVGAAAAVAFAVTLAMVVGNRLSNEAVSVLAGAACGVGAAIPTSLVLLAISRRRSDDSGQPAKHAAPRVEQLSPLLVVSPPAPQHVARAWGAPLAQAVGPAKRRFTVVGGTPYEQEVLVGEDVI